MGGCNQHELTLAFDCACMQVLGACLLRTLEQVMGKRWSLDEREAWLAVFSLIGKCWVLCEALFSCPLHVETGC